MFVCLFENDTVAAVDDDQCEIGDFKTAFLHDENGNKKLFSGVVIDILDFYKEGQLC